MTLHYSSLADTFLQSDLQLIRLGRGSVWLRGLAQGPNSDMDLSRLHRGLNLQNSRSGHVPYMVTRNPPKSWNMDWSKKELLNETEANSVIPLCELPSRMGTSSRCSRTWTFTQGAHSSPPLSCLFRAVSFLIYMKQCENEMCNRTHAHNYRRKEPPKEQCNQGTANGERANVEEPGDHIISVQNKLPIIQHI